MHAKEEIGVSGLLYTSNERSWNVLIKRDLRKYTYKYFREKIQLERHSN